MAKAKRKTLLRRPKTDAKYSVASGTHERKMTFAGYATIHGRELWMFHPQRQASKNKP